MSNEIITFEEWRPKCRLGSAVWERIKRLNPNGIEVGTRLRGWHPAHQFSRCVSYLKLVTVREFIDLFGIEQYRLIPKDEIVKNGKRKAIKGSYVSSLLILYDKADENMTAIQLMRKAILNGDL